MIDNVYLQRYNFIFISIPKTATNSIWKNLPKDYSRPFQHVKAKTIRDNVDKQTWLKYKFACVRNPYSLVKSWYFYHKYHSDLNQSVKDFYPDTFKDWVLNEELKTHWELPSHKYNNPLWDLSNPLHQTEWIYDKNELIVDCVMRYENLSEDFEVVAKKLNLENTLKKLNASTYNDEDYDLEMKDKVYSILMEDFDLLNYER